MESISNLLGRYRGQEPEETRALKTYIAEQFDTTASITVQPQAIIIAVKSASLANALRFRTAELQKIANTSKRLVFRIG